MKTVVILGAAHPFRGGGITTFNERLAKAFKDEGYEVVIYNFSLQYPDFLFPGKSQYTQDPPPTGLKILSKVNSINPFNWLKVGNELRRLKPDLVVVRFWLPLMGPSLGTILRLVRKNHHTRIIAITDNVIPHEKRIGDTLFTRYFLKAPDAFITMSEKVMKDLRNFEKNKPAIQTLHPLYDNFGEALPKLQARAQLKALTGIDISPEEKILLFFGFIRKYKGLDMLLEALHIIKSQKPGIKLKLVVAGEYYDDEQMYNELIQKWEISDMLVLKTGFIPDKDVSTYFSAADLIVQPYRNATQSGVTPLAYHFEKPMVVTNVGALPDYVPHGKVGLVAEPNPAAIANGILSFLETGEDFFLRNLKEEKKKYSWDKLVVAISDLARSINKS